MGEWVGARAGCNGQASREWVRRGAGAGGPGGTILFPLPWRRTAVGPWEASKQQGASCSASPGSHCLPADAAWWPSWLRAWSRRSEGAGCRHEASQRPACSRQPAAGPQQTASTDSAHGQTEHLLGSPGANSPTLPLQALTRACSAQQPAAQGLRPPPGCSCRVLHSAALPNTAQCSAAAH